MKILVISDIHANLDALEAVLEDAGSFDFLWCLGDLIGYGPDPNQCIERIRFFPDAICVLGNHDAAVARDLDLADFNFEARASLLWTKEVISADNLTYLKGLPEQAINSDVTLVHGSPRDPIWEYILFESTAIANFDHFSTRLCFTGHTHLPVCHLDSGEYGSIVSARLNQNETIIPKGRMIANPGSIGQPRDLDSRASYALYDPENLTWIQKRVEYDIKSVQQRIINYNLPKRHATRLEIGY